jgi:hypothetical protein
MAYLQTSPRTDVRGGLFPRIGAWAACIGRRLRIPSLHISRQFTVVSRQKEQLATLPIDD